MQSPEVMAATEMKAKYILTMSQLLNSIRLNKELDKDEIAAIKEFAVKCIRAELSDKVSDKDR